MSKPIDDEIPEPVMEPAVEPPKKKFGGPNGGGRPKGSLNSMAKQAREQAKLTGDLPHEFLLKVARGMPITVYRVDAETGKVVEGLEVPTLEKRIDAAKSAAPYFAPKISTVEVISGVSDDELDRIIADAAAQAGFSISDDGEGEEDEAPRAKVERKRIRE